MDWNVSAVGFGYRMGPRSMGHPLCHMWIGARDGPICSHKYRSVLPEKMRLPDSMKGIFYIEGELRKITLFSRYMDTNDLD